MDDKQQHDEVFYIKRLNGGDRYAFNKLFDHYATKLLCYSQYLTHNREDAEEVVQETFMKVWETRDRIRPDLSFNAYIITIAKHLIFNRAKRNILEKSILDYFTYTTRVADRQTEELIEDADYELFKNYLINKLPEKRKQILMLRKNGYSNDEVAELLKISKSTVANQINRGLKELKKLVERYSG
jgi:RNA polymerase sigma-70 factor, ECF subfamily